MHFTKMHGLGNSYIYLDGWMNPLPEEAALPRLAREMADPCTGIGSDGLILMMPTEEGNVCMRIFNSDGSEGKTCGNGLRCVSKYVYEHGYVKEQAFTVETLGGKVRSEVFLNEDNTVSEVMIDMGAPRLSRKHLPMKGDPDQIVVGQTELIAGTEYTLTAISMGNPHVVLFVDDIERAPVTTAGSVIENASLFPEGTNVEFVAAISENELDFKVWERGSGITQACGTGACAAVVAAILHGKANQDQEVTVHLPGGDLEILWSSKDEHVWMRGPAVTVCSGEYFQ